MIATWGVKSRDARLFQTRATFAEQRGRVTRSWWPAIRPFRRTGAARDVNQRRRGGEHRGHGRHQQRPTAITVGQQAALAERPPCLVSDAGLNALSLRR